MSKPQLRFNYNDEWDIYPLSKVVNNISTGKLDANAAKKNGKYRFFTCSKEDFLTNTYSFDGDAVIINGNGELGITKVYSGKFDAYQRTYVLMDFNQDFEYVGKAIPNYLPERLRTEAIGGAMPYIKIDTLEGLNIGIPSIDEQKDIASFLSNIDSLIEEKKNELEKTKQYKEAMLYKMFPKEGFKVPEIRFKGFEGEWETKVFEKVFDKLSNNSIKRDLLNYKKGNVKNIHYGDVLIKFGFTVDPSDMEVPYINEGEKVSKNAEDYLITGDVVFADTAEDTTAGKVTEIINPNGVKTLAGLHTYPCRPLDKYVPGFLGIMLNTSLFHNQLIPYMQGTKVTGFNYGQLCKTVIYYPGNEEQKKIVEFFDNLDSKIKNQEKEITILENYKATLLERMFA